MLLGQTFHSSFNIAILPAFYAVWEWGGVEGKTTTVPLHHLRACSSGELSNAASTATGRTQHAGFVQSEKVAILPCVRLIALRFVLFVKPSM